MVPLPRSAMESEGLSEWEIRGLDRGTVMADRGTAYAEMQGKAISYPAPVGVLMMHNL